VISGVRALIYSADAAADRAFLRDVLGLPHVDSGDGWLIFKAPPTELAVHPTDATPSHELSSWPTTSRRPWPTFAAGASR
jgi:hypothetical protein